ncbi:MAG: hypothetical protein AMXMBFR34_03350 [Myxococcaceae bacterium]
MRALALGILLGGCGGAALPHGAGAAACGSCHVEQHAQWTGTAHARSVASPVFQALLPRVEGAWGEAARARCVACHQPGHGGDEGLGCVTCHGAVGNRGTANGALVVSLDAPLAGTKRVSNAVHEVEPRGFLSSPALCGTCHEVHGPGLLDEPTLTEFTAASWADGCVGCHTRPQGERSHRLLGVDPPWGAAPSEATRSADEARALWARALTLELLGVDGAAQVHLTNTGAAHAVPTGATHLRDVWVDVEATDARGRTVLFPRVMQLGARLTREGAEVALVTDATRVEPRGLAPQERRTVRVELPPEGAPWEVSATLRARAVRADTLAALALEGVEVPELEVSRAARGR